MNNVIKRINYKGFTVVASPDQIRDSTLWTTKFSIEKEHSNGAVNKGFHGEEKHDSYEKAVKFCLEYGKNEIDKENSSVRYL